MDKSAKINVTDILQFSTEMLLVTYRFNELSQQLDLSPFLIERKALHYDDALVDQG
jgi:hypothetical protein